jgi:hypothetical protein
MSAAIKFQPRSENLTCVCACAKPVAGSQFLGGTAEKFSKGDSFRGRSPGKYVLLDREEY